MEPIVLSGPVLEPVTLAEAKAHCRIDSSGVDQDSLIEIYISAARDYLEFVTKRTIHRKLLQHNLDQWPCYGAVDLPFATPLLSIESIVYVDSDEVSHTWDASNYATSAGSRKKWGRVLLKSGCAFPGDSLSPSDPIRITYYAGIDPSASPVIEPEANEKLAILQLVARFFDIPEAEMITDRKSVEAVELKYGFRAIAQRLLAKYEF